MNRIQKIKKSIKAVDGIQYFGALLILIGLVTNPFVIEQLFSVNKDIGFGLKLCIVVFEIVFLILGALIIKYSKKIIKNKKNILINLSLVVSSI
ncbi:hypothetical protein HQ529_03135, partial [Candidatus Woesearchaeota archaeon]|nr:hypothetical protein [Candidatus Woesearchaeota archaeon]